MTADAPRGRCRSGSVPREALPYGRMSQASLKPIGSLRADLAAIVGETGLLEGAAVRERGAALFHGRVESELLVRPRDTVQVSAILGLCHARGQPVVTHGGLTGLVQGADAGRGEVVLSLESMNAIERVDVPGRSLRAQAGAQLGRVQREAEEHGMVFPLDLGARDSATVGGNISTNAGGLRVLRYGMMRNLVLGLEAVLADGTVLTSLNRMLKNNAGYDLKQLFIGSEGTLGVVTRAELRLVSRTRSQETLLASLPTFDAMVDLLGRLDSGLGGQLAAFEALWGNYYDYNTTPAAGNAAPLARGAPYYVIAEAVTNVGRYAGASHATVSVGRSNGTATVVVSDDGIGGADPTAGSGLQGLAARVEALDGHLDVVSPPGHGTRITAEMPLR